MMSLVLMAALATGSEVADWGRSCGSTSYGPSYSSGYSGYGYGSGYNSCSSSYASSYAPVNYTRSYCAPVTYSAPVSYCSPAPTTSYYGGCAPVSYCSSAPTVRYCSPAPVTSYCSYPTMSYAPSVSYCGSYAPAVNYSSCYAPTVRYCAPLMPTAPVVYSNYPVYPSCGCLGGMPWIVPNKPEEKKDKTDKPDKPDKPDKEDLQTSSSVKAPATLTVTLPADAKLTVDGAATKSTTGLRTFTTPDLAPGRTFSYTLKAEYLKDGQMVSAEKVVYVSAGKETKVSFEGATEVAAR